MISPAELDLARLTRADLDEVREALLDPSLGTLLDAAPVLERSAEATSYSPVGNPVYAPAEVSQMLVRG